MPVKESSSQQTLLNEYKVYIESRLSKTETSNQAMAEDIKDIKKTLRWLTGIIFGLNTTILGVLTKGFGAL